MIEARETRPTTLNRIEIRYSPLTTFRKIGIEPEQESKLALLDDPLEISCVKDPGSADTIYLAFLRHPFVGEHFIQLLDAVAPFPGGKNGVLADFGMPHSPEKENLRLNKGHRSDPEIGKLYADFVQQNLKSWDKAIDKNDFDPIFQAAERLRVFSGASMESVFSNIFSDFKKEFSQWGNKYDTLWAWKKREFHGVRVALLTQLNIQKDFIKFLSDLPKFKHSRCIDISSEKEIRLEFGFLDNEEQAKIILQFLKNLSKDQKEEFVIAHTTVHSSHLGPNVFLKNKKISWDTRVENAVIRDLDIVFPGGLSLELKGKNGEKIEVAVSKRRGFPRLPMAYRVSRYHFPQTFLENSLYPVIAWRKNSKGERKFLGQSEANPFLSKQADVYLGRVLAAYLLQDLTEDWKKEIKLAGFPRPQRMMGAQMPIWVSLDSDKYPYARQLLSNERLFPKLEQFAQDNN